MATIKQVFSPGDAILPASNPAAMVMTQGTNFPVPGLAFDATTQETAYFRMSAMSYGSGNVTATVEWYADTASANGITFGASLAAITPNTDTQDIETKAFDTEETVADTHLGTTGHRLHSIALTLTETDAVAAGDDVTLRLARKVADASDTMTGDAQVVLVIVEYTT